MRVLLPILVSLFLITHAQAQSWETGTANLGSGSGFSIITPSASGDLYGAVPRTVITFTPSFQINYFLEVFKSTDQGASFSSVASNLLPEISLVGDFKEFDGELFLAGRTIGSSPPPDWLARSSDGGTTWTTSGAGHPVGAISIFKDGTDLITSNTSSTYFRSTDNGMTWPAVSGSLDNGPYQTVGSRRYYTSRAGLKYSDDLGATRTLVLPGKNPSSDIVEFDGELFAYYSLNNELLRSADNGLSWVTSTAIPGHPDATIRSLLTLDGRLFAAVGGNGSIPSQLLFTENGDDWIPLQAGNVPTLFTQAFAFGDYIIANENGVPKRIRLRTQTGAPVFVAPPTDAIVSTGNQHTLSVFASGAGPLSYQWYKGSSGDTSNPIMGATSTFYQTPALNVSGDYWVRVTGAAGTSDSPTASLTVLEIWNDITAKIAPGLFNFLGPVPSPTGLTVYRSTTNAALTPSVDQSSDNGNTWTGNAGPNGVPLNFFANFSKVTFTGGAFYSLRESFSSDLTARLATSADGINWTSLPATFTTSTEAAEIIRDGNNIYIADRNGFFRSTDGGTTVTREVTGLSQPWTTGLVRTSNGTLVVSTFGSSVFTSNDDGLTWTQRFFVGTSTASDVTDLRELDGILYATLERRSGSSQGRGLWKSTNHGVTWSQVAFPSTELESVAMIDGKLFVTTKSAPPVIHSSSDGGVTFEPVTNLGLGTSNPGKLITQGDFAYLSTGQKLFRYRASTPSGEQVTITGQPQSVTTSMGTSTTLSVTIEGQGPVTYQWFRGQPGGAIPVGTNSPTFTTDPGITFSTTYFVSVTNGFGSPVISDLASVTIAQPPVIANDLKDKAYFPGNETTFGPTFAFGTPVNTTYQWYRGEPGNITNPIAGATTSRIGPPTISSGERVWLRATADGLSVDSAAASFTTISSNPGTIDLISRDPNGRTWDEAANSHLAESGNFAFFGSPDPGEGNSRHPLPYVAPQFIDESPGGAFGFGTARDISNNGRYLLFSSGWVHDATTSTSSPTFNPSAGLNLANSQASEISNSGRYVVFSSADSLIPNDTNGQVDLFLHDRTTGAIKGLTRFPDGSGNQNTNAEATYSEIDAAEQTVFLSHFPNNPLVPGESANLYIYDISSSTISVPAPLQGKGAYAFFFDASSNGRFILFSWNPIIQALRPSEPADLSAPRHWLYVYDRQEDELNFVDIPIGAEYTRSQTISNDGRTVSYINSTTLQPFISHSISASGPWATKLLIDPPTPSSNTADLQMGDDGSSFIYSTLAWSLQTPQYSTGSGGELNVGNVMYLSGISFGPAVTPPSFIDWASTELAAYPANLRGEEDDADGDGVPNIIAFLSGRTAATPRGPALTTQISPGGAITVTFRQRADVVRLLIPEFSADLGATGWADIRSLEVSRTEVEPGIWEITVAAPASAAADPKFFRLSTSP